MPRNTFKHSIGTRPLTIAFISICGRIAIKYSKFSFLLIPELTTRYLPSNSFQLSIGSRPNPIASVSICDSIAIKCSTFSWLFIAY